jgi:hypothetical protein
VGDAVFFEVAQGLGDGPDEVELGVEGEGLLGAQDVFAEIGRGDVVDQQVVLVEVVLFGEEVVLGQEHGKSEFDLGEDESLVGHPALPADLILLALDDDVFLQRTHPFEALLDNHACAI